MTDTELKRRKAICEAAHVDEIDDVSDGFHTFRQLYYQRMMLFAAIVKQNKDKAWKSLRHEDGELCFGGGWFIVGIDTPEGSYTYHYEDNYFSLFDCEELERGKHWDGHTEKDVTRLLSLSPAQPEPCEDTVSREALRKAMYHRAFETDGDTMWQSGCWIRYRAVEQVIKESPSVTPEQKTGKWILKKELVPLPWDSDPLDWNNYDEKTHSEWKEYYHCSNCDWKSGEFKGGNFCSNCGSYNGGEQDD